MEVQGHTPETCPQSCPQARRVTRLQRPHRFGNGPRVTCRARSRAPGAIQFPGKPPTESICLVSECFCAASAILFQPTSRRILRSDFPNNICASRPCRPLLSAFRFESRRAARAKGFPFAPVSGVLVSVNTGPLPARARRPFNRRKQTCFVPTRASAERQLRTSRSPRTPGLVGPEIRGFHAAHRPASQLREARQERFGCARWQSKG